jgi:L-threonylcarbamoyladenylate synthase
MEIIYLKNQLKAQVISEACEVLGKSGLVIFPTETCYGAGVLATSQPAVDKLLAYKTRREGKPLSIAVSDQIMASKYVNINTSASNLYKNFLPGPLTVVSKGKHKVARGVESETGTLGIRIPDYPLILAITKKLNKPITATSANASYKSRPYSIPQLLKNLSQKQQSLIDLVIDAGTLPKRPTSTVVDTTLEDPLLIRSGTLPFRNGNVVTTHSPTETINLAQTLMLKHWNDLQDKPVIFLLNGELGAGKTQFAKGIGEFLKIKGPITSPTYTIEIEYDYNRHGIKGKLLHLDTWRLQHLEEFKQLYLEKRLKPKTVVVVEWASRTLRPLLKIAKATKAATLIVEINTNNQEKKRVIKIKEID